MSGRDTAEPAVDGVDVLTFGEALVSFRSRGPLALGSPVVPGLAGAESNVAIALARLGHHAMWIGRFGADPFGELAVRELRAEGVDVRRVVREDGAAAAPTGLMFLEQRTADLSRVEYRRSGSAGSRLQVDDVQPAVSESPRVLHLTGITPALSPSAHEACVAAVETASAAGAFISLDVNYRARLWPRQEARKALGELARRVDLVVASDDELDLVSDGDEAAAVSGLLEQGVRLVAVKRGAAGASLWSASGRIDHTALPVSAVDTVGAGDAFCAGLLSGWLDGLDEAACLERASVLGAYAVSTHGDWEGLPRRSELAQFERLAPGATVR